ncbi:MAG: PRC-barrel domain-containing protein [Dehalococcoidia bacterium]
MKLSTLPSVVLLCTCLTGSALAQDSEPIVVDSWDQDFCRDSGASVEKLIDDVDVYGPVQGAEAIGVTEDLIIGSDGEVLALVAEIGGFLDIGDIHVSVPWDQVVFGEGWVRVPIIEETIGEYELPADDTDFRALADDVTAGVDDLSPGAGAWRASSLIGDAVNTRDGVGFGLVHDLLIAGDEAKAIIVRPNLGLGVFDEYAIPFQPLVDGEWHPGDPVFELVYDQTEMSSIGAFACD